MIQRAVACLACASAFAACLLPWVYSGHQDFQEVLNWGLGLSALWLILVISALAQWRRSAAWLLVLAPLALFFPVGLLLAAFGCSHGQACL